VSESGAGKERWCHHGVNRQDCVVCAIHPDKWHSMGKYSREDLRRISEGADIEFKIEGVEPCIPKCRMTVRLTESEAQALWDYCYLPATGTLVKYKVRQVLKQSFGDLFWNIVEGSGLPILILPWGNPMAAWMKENV
jgi:hypothetical protein